MKSVFQLKLPKRGIAIVLSLLFINTIQAQQLKNAIQSKSLTVKAVIEELQNKESFNFVYSGIDRELLKKVRLNTAFMLEDILQQLSSQTGLVFKVSGNTIAIKTGVLNGSINGIVTDMKNLPVEGATITLLNSGKNVISDTAGGFVFHNVSVGRYTLLATHISFEEKKIPVRIAGEAIENIALQLNFKTAQSQQLNPVIVTGQYRPQSLNKSIYHVEVIDKIQIQNMAVSTVAELLKQQLNIEIENQSGMGRSKIRVLGLNAQYVKILMDNIPIAGDENMGSDVDLSTISLDDVERVEIVKGAMGVEYGANSIGGVINIITKKTARNKMDITLEIQEETVRNEYNLSFDSRAKGRHIQRLNLSHKLTNKLSLGGALSRDKFNGYWGDREGAGIITKPIDIYYPPKRGYEWSPKESYNGNAYLSYTARKINVFYKFNLFRSDLTNYDYRAGPFLLKDEQLVVNASVNNDYRNHRYNHHLNMRGNFWRNAQYTLDASFQKNGLEHRRQGINLHDNSVINKANGIPGGGGAYQPTDWQKHYQSKGFYLKTTLLKPIIADKLDYNIGMEMDNTTGNQGYTNWFNDISLGEPIERTIFNGAIYTSAEWQITPKIMIRPGFRVNHNNKYKLRSNESVTTLYKLNDHNDIRLILGTSTRFPNYQELYSWFVDAVHDYRGNPDLRPEYGKSAELQWVYRRAFKNNIHLETSLSSMFQHIKDRIVSVTYRVPGDNRLTGRNTYDNENKYNGLLNQLNINIVSDKLSFALAGSILAFRGDDNATVNNYEKFLTNIQFTTRITYVLPANVRVSLFYRYVGREPLYSFIPVDVGYDLQPSGFIKVLNKTDAYQNVDFNVARSFWKQKLDIRLGVRNLFDVRDINYTPINPPPNVTIFTRTMRLYYGRSYFVKLTYNIFN